MGNLTDEQINNLIKVAGLSIADLPKTHKELHRMIWDTYEAGIKVSQVEPEVMVNFADLVDLLTDIEKHLDELYELAVIPEHLVSTYGNSQMNIGQRILELKSKISA